MAVYNSSIGRPWLPLSVHIWSHPPTQPMHEMIDELELDHDTGNYIVHKNYYLD